MICSVLIPTRHRPEKLVKAVESVRATSDPTKVEILLYFDHDDRNFDEFKSRCLGPWLNVWWVKGSPDDPHGYDNLHRYYDILSIRARGHWILIFNDDATIHGNGWDTQLAALPKHGVIAHPEWHHLGGSKYRTVDWSPFPFVPNNCWKEYGNATIPAMVDKAFDSMLREQNGWKPHLLSGVIIKHDRGVDETLPRSRY